jgi:hypothetical protein
LRNEIYQGFSIIQPAELVSSAVMAAMALAANQIAKLM